MLSLRSSIALTSLVSLALLAAPRTAQACGGTFCDNLPNPMPVDQRGEDILFVIDGPTIEVHVRIEYTGEAERFAWVLPIQGIPEVTVGSDPLFTAMSSATAPRREVEREYDCNEDRPGWGQDSGGTGDDGGGCGPGGCLDLESDPGPPEVVYEAVVGAFEVVVLQGGTAIEVIDFLTANNYAQDPAAEPILQEYLDEGFLFAAVKLTAGAEVDEIHPLTFRFQGDEPCVPIRLTRIAAKDDMGIRAYFLAQDRWAPSNYEHVVLNPLYYDWSLPASFKGPTTDGYLEHLSVAVDEAGGHAFVTEYADPSSSVLTGSIYRETWDETAFVGVDPIAAIDIIGDQGLNTHPLIRSLLAEFIPVPDGLSANEFWNNIARYANQIDQDAWNADAFATALVERIIDPGLHAVDLLDTWPQLTRLHTTISPSEMTLDPTFHANVDLPAVSDTWVTTTNQVLCGGDQLFHVNVEDVDTPVCVPEGSVYPASAPHPAWQEMPAALRIEQIPMMGPPQLVQDNAELIASVYAGYQSEVECVTDESVGDDGGSEEADGGNAEGGSEDSGYNLPYDTTCGCSTPGGSAPLGIGLGLLVLGLIGPWRRRERQDLFS
ncbi:hypothetical protein DB30_04791 [Enhygromyxa salina]|uniref:DUF2330 domain-containing protein n=1 Tax=Enhygromyxa salina TaxID=215803 RepID=A0A0C2CZD4_9BACT|nr:DUF2330 domain-containing protein [Enhygromyxa salina]KIG16331.1 hypothetical protein DB30_04791 [Enhygromyxa salina]